MEVISRLAADPLKSVKITRIYRRKVRLIFFKKSLVKFFTMRHCPSASGGIGRFFGVGISVPWSICQANGTNQNYLTLALVGRAADNRILRSTIARTASLQI